MYAGGDIFVMPSRYEPCGISQVIAMNYGCIPVAHATGGLKDSIIDSNNHKESTGFLFSKLSSSTLSDTLSKVIKLYKNYPDTWIDIQKNGMKTDFSWRISSQKYYELYLNLLKEHRIINS